MESNSSVEMWLGSKQLSWTNGNRKLRKVHCHLVSSGKRWWKSFAQMMIVTLAGIQIQLRFLSTIHHWYLRRCVTCAELLETKKTSYAATSAVRAFIHSAYLFQRMTDYVSKTTGDATIVFSAKSATRQKIGKVSWYAQYVTKLITSGA